MDQLSPAVHFRSHLDGLFVVVAVPSLRRPQDLQ